MKLLWEDRAWSDYLYWQTQDKKTLKRNQRADKGYSEKPLPGDRQAGAAAGEPERLVEPPH